MNVLGLIPARAGSKRLPKKNTKELAGLPLVEHTIRQACASERLTTIALSTDDCVVMDIGCKYQGVRVISRPEHLCSDDVRNIDVMTHALQTLENEHIMKYDILILLQPTSPFRQSAHIDIAVELIALGKCESVIGVKGPYKKRDPILKRIENSELKNYCKDDEPFYIQNAAIYAINRSSFLQNKSFVNSSAWPLVMDELSSIDIDTDQDFRIAEALYPLAASR